MINIFILYYSSNLKTLRFRRMCTYIMWESNSLLNKPFILRYYLTAKVLLLMTLKKYLPPIYSVTYFVINSKFIDISLDIGLFKKLMVSEQKIWYSYCFMGIFKEI